MAWQTPKTDWKAGDIPSSADFNRIEGNTKVLNDDLTAHKTEKAALNTLGHVQHATFTITLDTDWVGDGPPYTKTQTITGITVNDTPIIDVIMSGDFETDKDRLDSWSFVYRAVTANNAITFYAIEKPYVDLPLQIKVVR